MISVRNIINIIWAAFAGPRVALRPVRVLSRSEMMRIMRIQAARRRQM